MKLKFDLKDLPARDSKLTKEEMEKIFAGGKECKKINERCNMDYNILGLGTYCCEGLKCKKFTFENFYICVSD